MRVTNDDTDYINCIYDTYYFARRFFREVQNKSWVHADHFSVIGEVLDRVICGLHPTNNIIFNMPPRSGKTELAIVNFIAKGFAVNPASQFIHLSASDLLVTRNVTNIRNIMESPLYRRLFPEVHLTNSAKGSIETDEGGVLYAAPFMGQVTGFGCGILDSPVFSGALIVDDPIKTQEAFSDTIREKYNFTWANTIISRKNDERTPVIITAQRVHEKDLCGMLIEEEGLIEEGGQWDVIKFPAIIDEGLPTERSMWELRYSLEYLKRQRKIDPWVFETQYMQNPRPIEGLLFPEDETQYFTEQPQNPEVVFIQVDPADEGEDCYCSKVFAVKDNFCYNVETMYTEDRLEITVPRQKDQIIRWKPSYVNIESNSAWRLVAKEIKEWAASTGLDCEIRRFSVHENKELRIFNEAPTIRNRFKFLAPDKQNAEYAKCMRDRHSYLKMGKNQKDDGVDCDAAASHWAKKSGLISLM